LDLLKKVIPLIDDVRVKDIVIYDMKDVTPLYDYAVICTASSNRQVSATIEHLKDGAIKHKFDIRNVEGASGGVWVLVDLQQVIVHIFTQEERDRYALDRLFSSMPQIDVERFLTKVK
jgi:ribosome-associated protein